MNRTQIINSLIEKHNFKSYLEIGVESGANFFEVNCEDKTGVDPDKTSQATIHKTSDDFFKTNKKKFDICFIDGLHHAEQVYKDAINCLKFLNEGGIVLFHDLLPTSEGHASNPRSQNIWNGDCYKAFIKLRTERKDLEQFTISCDWGVGYMKKGKQELLDLKGLEINYQNFDSNRDNWLNLKSVEWFKDFLLK